jgi:hypothetical protein
MERDAAPNKNSIKSGGARKKATQLKNPLPAAVIKSV